MSETTDKVGKKRQERAKEARRKVLKRRTRLRADKKEEAAAAAKERDAQRDYNRLFVTVRNDNKGRQDMLSKIEHNAKVLEAIEAAEKEGLLKEEPQEDGSMFGGCAGVTWTPNPEPEVKKEG